MWVGCNKLRRATVHSPAKNVLAEAHTQQFYLTKQYCGQRSVRLPVYGENHEVPGLPNTAELDDSNRDPLLYL